MIRRAGLALCFAAALGIILSGCTSRAGDAAPDSRLMPRPPLTGNLPGLAELDEVPAARQTSEVFSRLVLDGAESFMLHDPGAPVNGERLTLSSGSETLAWAIFRFESIDALTKIGDFATTYDTLDSGVLYTALSNYDTGRWEWYSATTAGGQDVHTSLRADSQTNYVSPGGSVYLVAALWGGMQGELQYISLGPGLIFDTVTGISASDSTSFDTVVITWDEFPGATGYRISTDAHQVEDDPVELVFVEGGQQTEFIHGPGAVPGKDPVKNVPLVYSVQARIAEGIHTERQIDTGTAGLGRAANFSASHRGDADEIILRWDAVTGADGYNIFLDGNLLDQIGLIEEYSDTTLREQNDYDLHSFELEAFDEDGAAPFRSLAFGAVLQIDGAIVDVAMSSEGQFAAALFDFSPHALYCDTATGEPKFAAGELPQPQVAPDFTLYSLDEADVDNRHNALATVAGFPALAFYSGADEVVRYGFADTVAPNSGGDWQVAGAIPGIGDPDSVDLVALDGLPAIVFACTGNRIRFARPADATPQGPQDWQVTNAESGPGLGSGVSMEVVDGRPAIAYVKDGQLIYSHALSANPQGGADWPQVVLSAASISGQTDIANSFSRPFIAYRAQNTPIAYDVLRVAVANVENPSVAADWTKMDVFGALTSDCAFGVQFVELSSGVALLHEVRTGGGTDNRKVYYHKARTSLPKETRDWDSQILVNDDGYNSGDHCGFALLGGGLGMLFNRYDALNDSYDLHWMYEIIPES